MHRLRLFSTRIVVILSALLVLCLLLAACSHPPESTGPKFSGRLFLLAGDNVAGADLIEISAAEGSSTYNHSVVTSGVFEAVASPDQTRLLYATKDEILLRDLRSGAVKPLVKGENFCLAWSPDGNRFSYKQKSPATPLSEAGAGTKLYVSDLDGKTKLIWEDPLANYTVSQPGQSPVLERAAGSSGCAHWIAPDRFIFDRFVGALPKQKKGSEALKPNTTTLAILSDSVKLSDTERKWSIESICPAGTVAFLRPHDQSQPILIARTLEQPLKTLDPSPGPCSGCRFVGFAAQSCVPFFIEDATSTSSELFYLNPTNWQKQRGTRIERTFSVSAKMLIKSSAKLMIVGDVPAALLLIDTESGEIVPFFPKSAEPGASQGKLLFPVPVVWIEK